MSTPATDPPRVGMQVHGSRASSVIVHRVPADKVERFMELERSISQTVATFAGYQGTEVYPAADGRQEWVVIIHFNDASALQVWLDSPARAEWIARFRDEIGEFRLKSLPAGFGSWFVGQEGEGVPPGWKMALMVLLGLYPTVMLLGILTGPYTAPLGLAVSMLVGNALSISILQWAVMPVLTTLLSPWIRARADKEKTLAIGGLIGILLVLGSLAILFRLVTG